jgi:hypothetical protein
MTRLTLNNLVAALDEFPPDYYDAIDVFADDLQEIEEWRRTGEVPASWRVLDATSTRFVTNINNRLFEVQVFEQAGVVRVRGMRDATPSGATVTTGAVLGSLAGTAIGAASSRKGDGWAPGLILGLLVGAAVGALATQPASAPAPRRVFTLRFDPATQEWVSYDGGLVPWMKSNLLTPAA